MKVGPRHRQQQRHGPAGDEAHFEKVKAYVDSGVAEGPRWWWTAAA